MCGICGIIDWKTTLSDSDRQGTVHAMNAALTHRGPDDAGSLSHGIGSLAMRRLSIIDRQGGHQPIYNETEDIVVVFNGEIYNYPELKNMLLEKGHQFRTNADTEVLVHLYESFGTNMLDMILGMFSFCIYDQKKQTYFLARDAFGEKPLYYYWDGETFSFSSEIKSLLENKNIPRKLNHEALPYYFKTSLVPEPLTLLDQVKSVPSGHFVFLSKNNFELTPYFKADYEVDESLDESEAIELVRPFLVNAVKRQMISDVPIGAFLSGGIDSSTIVALLARSSDKKINTFNVRFENQAYDESAIARKVAEYCGTEHHEIFVPNVDFEESIFWKIIDHVGLPFRDSSAIPSYLISQEIAKHVKVALSGDGGDELFGGYDLFQWYQKIVDLKKIVRPVRSALNGGLGMAQQMPGLNNSSLLRKLKRGVRTSLLSEADISIALNELYKDDQIDRMLRDHLGAVDQQYLLLKEGDEDFASWSPLRKIMYYRLIHTLPSNMLIKVDRMSMANSLEVRCPFLDRDLFAISAKLPDNLLVRQGKGKYLLRKIMREALPPEVFDHPKMGFSIPLYQYQNEAFKKLAQRLLFDENPWPELIPVDQLKEIYHRGIYTQKDDANYTVFQTAHQLWMLMQLFGWGKRFNVQN